MHRRTIFINGRFLTKPLTGVQRYALELVKQIDKLLDQRSILTERYQFILLTPKQILYQPELSHISSRRIGFMKGVAWEQFELPYYTRGQILFNPCNSGTIIKSDQIVTIHDAAVYAIPHNYAMTFRWWCRFLYKWVGARACIVLTVSQFSKNELHKYCAIDNDKIKVVYQGKEHMEQGGEECDDSFLYDDKPFVLAVSSITPNKNFSAIMKAMELLSPSDYRMVIVGRKNPGIYAGSELALSSYVQQIGYVNDRILRKLYKQAACFIFPSFYEGFGLPPLEAMFCGCPVIVSDRAALPEVCGDAAVYCNPDDPLDLADKIRMLMGDPQLRQEMRKKGAERASRFSWNKCAVETLQVINEYVR